MVSSSETKNDDDDVNADNTNKSSILNDENSNDDVDDGLALRDAYPELSESKHTVEFKLTDVNSLDVSQFSDWLQAQGLLSEECNIIKGNRKVMSILHFEMSTSTRKN